MVAGGAIDSCSSTLRDLVVAPTDELRLDLRTGEKGIVRCTIGGVLDGGTGKGRGGPVDVPRKRGHSGIVGNCISDRDNVLRSWGFSIGNG